MTHPSYHVSFFTSYISPPFPSYLLLNNFLTKNQPENRLLILLKISVPCKTKTMAPINFYPISAANISNFPTALASLSEFLNNKFTLINNNPKSTDDHFLNLYHLILLFQATHRVRITLLFTHGKATSGLWLPLPSPNRTLLFSPEGVNMFLMGLTKIGADVIDKDEIDEDEIDEDEIDVDELAGDSEECYTPTNNDQAKKAELHVSLEEAILGEQLMPENRFKLACGHYFCENCLRERIADGLSGGHSPTCPMCEAALEGMRDVKVPGEAEVIITLDKLRALAAWLGPSAINTITRKAVPVYWSRY